MSVCVSVTSDFIQSHFLFSNVGRARHGMWQIGVVLVPDGPVDSAGIGPTPIWVTESLCGGSRCAQFAWLESIQLGTVWCGAILKVYSKQRRTRGHVEAINFGENYLMIVY